MKQQFGGYFAILVLAWCAGVAQAGVSNTTVDRLFEVSGLKAQLGYFPDMVVLGLDQAAEQGGAIPREDYDAIVSSVRDTVVPAEILEAVRFSLRSSLSEEDARYLLEWYESPAGRRVTQAEKQGSSPEAYEASLSPHAAMSDTVRVAYAQRLDALLGLTDFNITIQENTSVAVYAGVLAALQPSQPADLGVIKAQVKGLLDQSRPAIQKAVIQSSVYTYRNLSMADLMAYEAFLEDSRARHFNDRVMAGLGGGMEESVTRLGIALGKVFSRVHR